ncbi:hypothetical protein [Spirosoma oryzicola]|uniref:hypothetical protein n=1 Tax=Spirosoma oryzicola TaxID=2898794 RepID=UPI001E3B25DF|nr:hypothetical protein [Spirosoma oryzicola]UHG91795.1 hypothetical protein LQ777_02590 [Spirosoma oryzicola]
MFIYVDKVNGNIRTVRIGVQYIVMVEPYESPREPDTRAVITLPNLVLNVTQTADEVNAMIDAALNC